uniref:EF-hand domain-containing protein n=1 Tax=Globodera rostochiensis TaxID=31243 RepID=A0A914I9N7_GLORO
MQISFRTHHFNLKCREIFCYFDSKGDEKINVKQVGDVLRALGQSPTESEIRKCCEHWTDSDARISFEEFVPIFQTVSKTRAQYTKDQFVEGLSHFDREGNGTIAVAELKHLLTNLGERLTEEEVEQLLTGHEVANGFVSIDSFIETVLRDSLIPDNVKSNNSAVQTRERKTAQS